jgi:uncharacterized protein YndB with AHSA1/START domain
MSAKTTKRFFSRETEVSIDIDASASVVWGLLTNARAYPEWNGTVVSIEGEIALGGTITLTSTLDPKRKFKLKVKELVKDERLVWGDAMGRRTFTLTPRPGGVTFAMHEKIGGPIFPLFARMIPSFDEAFDRFASDLKRRAELG